VRVYESSTKQESKNIFSFTTAKKHMKTNLKDQIMPGSPQRFKIRISAKSSPPHKPLTETPLLQNPKEILPTLFSNKQKETAGKEMS